MEEGIDRNYNMVVDHNMGKVEDMDLEVVDHNMGMVEYRVEDMVVKVEHMVGHMVHKEREK